jgi:hypothetical protein
MLFAGGNTGWGMACNNRTHGTTFMRRAGAQAGPGDPVLLSASITASGTKCVKDTDLN